MPTTADDIFAASELAERRRKGPKRISEAQWRRLNDKAGAQATKEERQCSGCGVAIGNNESGKCLVCQDIDDFRRNKGCG